jgi:AraC-like DNA-binding protein
MSIAAFFIVKAYKGYSSSLHSHPFWEIVYNKGAGGELDLGGKKYKYSNGTVMVLPSNVPHVQTSSGDGLHLCLLVPSFEAEGLKELHFKDTGPIKQIFEELATELNGKKVFYRAVMDADVLRLLSLLKRKIRGKQEMPVEDERLKKVRKAIDSNIDNDIDLDALAGSFLLSKEYLREVFKKEYGVTPVRYIIQKKIEKAKVLLSEKKSTIKEIAAVCGFEDEYYFSRMFKKMTGIAPIQYRRAAK